MNILFLVGPRGSGKSEVAKALAKKCGCPALDTDDLVVQKAEKSIAAIVAEDGWDVFRLLERDALRRTVQILTDAVAGDKYCGKPPTGVVATGGGAILDPGSREFMIQAGQVVYLKAPADVLAARLKASPDAARRPPFGNMTLEEEVAATLSEREPLYTETASTILDATQPVATLVDQLHPIFIKQSNA